MRLWPRREVTGAQVARRLEREYDDARATLALVRTGDLTVSQRKIVQAEAIVLGYTSARLDPSRPWWDEETEMGKARKRAAHAGGALRAVPEADPVTERIYTRGGQS